MQLRESGAGSGPVGCFFLTSEPTAFIGKSEDK